MLLIRQEKMKTPLNIYIYILNNENNELIFDTNYNQTK